MRHIKIFLRGVYRMGWWWALWAYALITPVLIEVFPKPVFLALMATPAIALVIYAIYKIGKGYD